MSALVFRAPGVLSAPGNAPYLGGPPVIAARDYVPARLTDADGTAIASLPDSGGGAALAQATSGAQPVLATVDGIRSLVFDGVDDRMSTTFTRTAGQPLTVVLIGKMAAPYASGKVLADAAGRRIFSSSAGSVLSLFNQGAGAGGFAASAGWRFIAARFWATGATLTVDGSTGTSAAAAGAAVSGTFDLGGLGASSAMAIPAIARAMLFEGDLTLDQIATIRSWARERYPLI